MYAGFPHIFLWNEQVADNFINACVRYRKNYKKYNDRLEGHDIKSFIPELGSDIKSLIPELSKIKASSKDSVQKHVVIEWDSKATARTWTYGGNNKSDSRNRAYSRCQY